jgi:HK97 family phage portal protein
MNILKKFALWTAQKAAGYGGVTFTLADQNNPKMSSFFGSGTATGKNVTDQSAMQVTAFFACIRLLSETMGAMPSSIYQTQKNGNAEKVDHPLAEVLIEQPNADMNGIEYREASTANLAARGNAYSLIERRGDGNVLSLYPLSSARVQVKRDSSTNYEVRYGIQDRGQTEWYPSEKIWHRKGFGFDGLIGLSPLTCAREAIGLALAGEEFNARLFGQGLMPSARVSIPVWLTDEQRIIANKKMLEMHTGMQNLGKPMLLEGGMKVEDGLLSPDDAQFLQLRQFTVVEICRLMGIKPHMIASLEQATNNNIEQMSAEFNTFTMMPHMRRDEMAARKLFKPGDRSKFFYKYNFEGLLRADSAARASLYSILLQNGVYNRNEVRALENRNSVDDPAMNQYTVQSNMAMIDQLAALVAGRNTPAAPAPAPNPVKQGDTNIYVSPPSVTLHQKAADITVHIPERESHVEVKMPDMKASDIQVDVHMASKTKTTYNRDPDSLEVLTTVTEEF